MRVMVDKRFQPTAKTLRGLGVNKTGKVQVFATDRIIFRMRRYMPWLTGLTATSLTMVTGPAEITVNAPYAQKLYYGDHLNFTKTTNPLAGAHWDRTLMQYEGKVIAQEIEDYARSLK